MRQALEPHCAELAHLYGIRPWELDELNLAEADRLLEDLRKRQQQQAEHAARVGLRGRP